MDGSDTVYVWGNIRLRANTFKINLGLFGWGYGRGALPTAETRYSPLLAGEFGFNIATANADFYAQVGGLTNFRRQGVFRHSECIPVGVRILLFGRTDNYPTAFAAVQSSAVKVRTGETLLQDQQWGGQFGLRFDTPFERFCYSYSTGLGGYHRIGIFFKSLSAGFVQAGTRYEYIKLDGVEMFRVQLQLEGIGWDTDQTESLAVPNTRPWWHKGLAAGATLPVLPIVWVVSLFDDQ
jgi:hypothetical protein